MMEFDVEAARRVGERWGASDAQIGAAAAGVLLLQACYEIDRLRLTAEERQAIEVAIRCVDSVRSWKAPQDALREKMIEHSVTLRGLLERTQ